ncbi:MAG: alpha-hydroxy-acid oxidizing protein [Sphingomonadales bacterium]|nr:alpha-hydroxy-acid oxidizing protein [Sphingomonadales bacterium]
MDFRAAAQARLPSPLFHYIDGGADDEWSLRNNTAAFERYELQPSQLRDVSRIDMTTRVLGVALKVPVICSPTGMTRLFHHGKELAVAHAAARAGVMYCLSTMATTSLEDVARSAAGPKMFQIYVLKDRELTREFVHRAKEAGYDALCLTVDTPVAGNRERDRRTGMVMPPKLTWSSLASFVAHPVWSFHFLTDPDFRLANVAHRVDALGGGAMGLIGYVNSQFDRTVTWDDAAWLADQWDGPFVIKGIQSAADAQRCAEIGASAVMVSNHGGRQLDGTPAPIDCIRPIRDRVGDALELIVDGGVRRGVHVLKALALGADACAFGRPYLYGLAAGGEKGVDRVLALMRDEIERSLALLGRTNIRDVGVGDLRPKPLFNIPSKIVRGPSDSNGLRRPK